MCNQIPKESSNSLILKGLCGVLPAAVLAAVHWSPWARDLNRLQSFVVGTAAMAGTAMAAIALSNGDKEDHVAMLGIAVASAGGITAAVYETDNRIKQRATIATQNGRIANLEAQIKALQEHGDI